MLTPLGVFYALLSLCLVMMAASQALREAAGAMVRLAITRAGQSFKEESLTVDRDQALRHRQLAGLAGPVDLADVLGNPPVMYQLGLILQERSGLTPESERRLRAIEAAVGQIRRALRVDSAAQDRQEVA